MTRAWFQLHPEPSDQHSAMPPKARIALLDQWQEQSAAFAATRGYCPDLDAMRDRIRQESWAPPDSLAADRLCGLISLADAVPPSRPVRKPGNSVSAPGSSRGAPVLTIRLRPWASRLLQRTGVLRR